MKRYWLVALAVTALVVACGGSDDTSALRAQVAALQTQLVESTAALGDRVAGIEIRCDYWRYNGPGVAEGPHRDYWGAICTDDYPLVASANASDSSVGARDDPGGRPEFIYNRRKVLTIRGHAYSYAVAVPLTTKVAVGDEWPPK